MAIADNPSIKDIHRLLDVCAMVARYRPAFRLLGRPGRELVARLDALDLLRRQAEEITQLLDRFNARYGARGWIVFEGFPTEALRAAVAAADRGDPDQGEEVLIDAFDRRRIARGFLWFRHVTAFRPRERLLHRALADHVAGRYHASVPVVLAQIDGLVFDLTGQSFYGARPQRSILQDRFAHLLAADTIGGHASGLLMLARMWSSTRPLTSAEPLAVPYRHGILHGRDLGYDTRRTSAQSLATLLALHGWARCVDAGRQHAITEPLWPDINDPEPDLASLRQLFRNWGYGWANAPRVDGRDRDPRVCQ